jgi:thiamine kinase-like enzyme
MSQTMIITKLYHSRPPLLETLRTNPCVKSSPTSISSPPVVDEDSMTTRTKTTTTIYQNNPYKIVPIHVDTTASQETCYANIQEVIKILCPFLVTTSSSSSSSSSVNTSKATLSIRPLTGGLSNLLFLVSSSSTSHNNNIPTTVLVRIHPESTGHHVVGATTTSPASNPTSPVKTFSIVNRELENRFAAWLATQSSNHSHMKNNLNNNNLNNNNHKLAPSIFGRFNNGRVEEFYDNVRPLSCPEMKRYAKHIAPQMAFFHQLSDPSSNILPRPALESSTLYETINAWFQEASWLLHQDEKKDDNVVVVAAATERALLDRLSKEWMWLREQLSQPALHPDMYAAAQAYRFIRRVAVTHMDCQSLNILVAKDVSPLASSTDVNLRLIDFEYSGWNPVAADIANTFCEYCDMSNLRADYPAEYPSDAQQEEFFWYYCQAYPRQEFTFLPQRRDSEEWKRFAKALQQEVGRFSLLSHLGWAVWSIIKSKEDVGVDFDYILYANHRIEGYDWAKTKFFG